jgi:hypothetical protein
MHISFPRQEKTQENLALMIFPLQLQVADGYENISVFLIGAKRGKILSYCSEKGYGFSS